MKALERNISALHHAAASHTPPHHDAQSAHGIEGRAFGADKASRHSFNDFERFDAKPKAAGMTAPRSHAGRVLLRVLRRHIDRR